MQLVVYLKNQTIKSPIYADDSDTKATMMAVKNEVIEHCSPFRRYIAINLNDWSVTIKESDLIALEVQ
ncbi:hypothetical protein [Lactiplantibacillus plantarum]|uniref:hypothetical protein n=1 Tax=Lactiplantibacillus plantarum TaxID=1590 RepID=UPI000EFD73A7|nr:hypothetical protein [Lactiplantibacillus plantarum]MCS8589621.1 hypothetical protein [Lactiplantibacillus plantarum]MCT3234734.1 hypothetical protein [Lactiplantibacillus plantarum]QAA28186.1 hypothetical protein C0682_05940 [Lactiplantibacillus plantarum]QHM49010.1 hypothetical protein C7M40_00938 [Lactiplantibacillus plantarum]QJY42711.1 hypothetical protein HPB53_07195 [Lactiplantibacillus plantarum]